MALYVDIHKDFGGFALDVSFQTETAAMALLGASGSGKSMTLKCIAGVETPDRGKIVLDGVTLFDSEKKINLSPQKRHVGYLFQNYALFPTMTVEQNLRTGMGKGMTKAMQQEKLTKAVGDFHLEGLEKRLPSQLSGGQQQRVALARILLSQPKLLMLDEPFSALDSFLRWELEQTVSDVIAGFPGVTLVVSHNRDEAYHLCSSIAVVSGGKIDVQGVRDEMFANPATRAAALLTGCKNIAFAVPSGETALRVAEWGLTLELDRKLPPQTSAVGIRAHYFVLNGTKNPFRASVERVVESPFSTIYMVRPLGAAGLLRWEKNGKPDLTVGDEVSLSISPADVMALR